ncbi:WSC domain-containing protein [Cordyceps militaris CM01]|uniref:WSC domain-containing protein n=1 Tax=Cordyceps militaris (strain CM01) TaxID=983644 RepID=G3JGS2_CORMM|nr:WSC domain-containing protein [Cordyceps militaris CM01]EGX92436.1 WSC domain-containing protein [Cordyceps militaris CM01]
MRSAITLALPAMAALGATANTHANLHHVRAPMPIETGMPRTGTPTLNGCYSSFGNMTKIEIDTKYLSNGSCGKACTDSKNTVAAVAAQACYCGTVYPPKKDVIDASKCDYGCNGFGEEMCGSISGAYSVLNLGVVLAPGYYSDASSSSSSSPSPTPTSGSSSAASTSTGAATGSPDSSTGKPEKSGGGPNTAAIAAGVVVGVVVAAAIIGAIIFFIRRKRNAEIEEEHRRNAAVNAFISGSKPPSTAGGISITDSRLDPVMAHRRLSDGSIADNQDYSRKILRVTNA